MTTTKMTPPEQPKPEQPLSPAPAQERAGADGLSPSPSPSPAAVQVFVRIRPLIQEENKEGHTCMECKVTNNKNKKNDSSCRLEVKIPPPKTTTPHEMNPAFQLPPRFLQKQQQQRHNNWKGFDGFTSILTPEYNNEMVYQTTVQPLVQQLVQPPPMTKTTTSTTSPPPTKSKATKTNTTKPKKQRPQPPPACCVFTYGHTGSGKTHTLLGYDKKDDHHNLGIYKYGARDLFSCLEEQHNCIEKNNNSNDNDNTAVPPEYHKRMILVCATELYKDTRDLLTGDICNVREDQHGVVHIRGPLVEDDQGRLDPRPLGKLCRTAKEVVECIDSACTSRRTGTSTHHKQSSRSHLILELEIVTPAIVQQRQKLALVEAHLTRLQWLQTERHRVSMQRSNRQPPAWTKDYESSPMKLRREIVEYEALVKTERTQLHTVMEQDILLYAGRSRGTLVFCDLAGNEYAKDAAGSTKQEMEEAAAINSSLLAVKELIRSLKNHQNHVSYRNSKLSMMLKRHLQGESDNHHPSTSNSGLSRNASRSVGTRAIMLGHISPSHEYVRKTINTLTYCSMVAANDDDNANTKGKSGNASSKKVLSAASQRKNGKENKPGLSQAG